MTFEEFFAKKKIDLEQLGKVDPSLFSEFKSHFSLMGEKSFDHTKKFWFNKLRRQFPLASIVKEVPPKAESKIAAQAEPLSSPTIEQAKPVIAITPEADTVKPAVNKPAFKPRNIPQAKPELKAEENENVVSSAPVSKAPGFKPGNIKPPIVDEQPAAPLASDESAQSAPVIPEPSNEQPSVKPAFKPRFNMKNIQQQKPAEEEQKAGEHKAPEAKESSAAQKEADETEKPASTSGYKPRFKMKSIPLKTPSEEVAAESVENEVPKADSNAAVPEEESKEESSAPTPAYKPRFKMKNLPQQKAAEEVKPSESSEKKASDKESSSAEKSVEDVSTVKPAYKPKFNMKNLPQQKPKPVEEAAAEATNTPEEVESPEGENVANEAETSNENKPVAAKPAYKPKFNMKNIKPKSEE